MKPTDLRGILQYIPLFRDKTFVVEADGAVVTHMNFANLLLDIAVLRSLNIRVVLVHGAAQQVQKLAAEQKITPSNLDGTGVTDDATLKLSLTAANGLTHEILEGFATNDLRAANANVIAALPLGVIDGLDHQHTGTVERVDTEMLQTLLSQGITPVIPPLGFDGKGNTYRLNSDAVGAKVAQALQATKLIFISTEDGLTCEGDVIRQILSSELEALLADHGNPIPPAQQSKARHAAEACAVGIPRVHLINGLVTEGLLAEVFSNEGIGTLVFANEYRHIRPARKRDAASILRLTREAMDENQLVERSEEMIEENLDDYFLYEIDENPVACVALRQFPGESTGELAHLYVNPMHGNQGIGRILGEFVEQTAREAGLKKLVTLSTQAFSFFSNKLGYSEGTGDDLPEARREEHSLQGRNSKILIKQLT
ncbi:MAG: amino-acid N-acetyltransferase [Verrucomicrobiales bacterium]|nr:amino-acid N-acetyltransferase [Verrucomicrobiales bacterium]